MVRFHLIKNDMDNISKNRNGDEKRVIGQLASAGREGSSESFWSQQEAARVSKSQQESTKRFRRYAALSRGWRIKRLRPTQQIDYVKTMNS